MQVHGSGDSHVAGGSGERQGDMREMEEEVERKDVVPVFYPTMDDMRGSFERYIESIEDQFAAAGICKIVPPKAWSPRKESCVPPHRSPIPLSLLLLPHAVSSAPLPHCLVPGLGLGQGSGFVDVQASPACTYDGPRRT